MSPAHSGASERRRARAHGGDHPDPWRSIDGQPKAAQMAQSLEVRGRTPAQIRLRRRFEKPSAMKRRKEKAARFTAMLKARYADD